MPRGLACKLGGHGRSSLQELLMDWHVLGGHCKKHDMPLHNVIPQGPGTSTRNDLYHLVPVNRAVFGPPFWDWLILALTKNRGVSL